MKTRAFPKLPTGWRMAARPAWRRIVAIGPQSGQVVWSKFKAREISARPIIDELAARVWRINERSN